MEKVGFTILFFFFLLFAAILSYTSNIDSLFIGIIIGFAMLFFPSFISKNLVLWLGGISLFITPKSGRNIMCWYTLKNSLERMEERYLLESLGYLF